MRSLILVPLLGSALAAQGDPARDLSGALDVGSILKQRAASIAAFCSVVTDESSTEAQKIDAIAALGSLRATESLDVLLPVSETPLGLLGLNGERMVRVKDLPVPKALIEVGMPAVRRILSSGILDRPCNQGVLQQYATVIEGVLGKELAEYLLAGESARAESDVRRQNIRTMQQMRNYAAGAHDP